MITERELLEAIRACESEPITATKTGKLADFYIIYDHLFGDPYATSSYSGTAEKTENTIETNGGSEFLRAVDGKNAEKVLSVIDELVEATRVLHPRMYDGFLLKIEDI